MSRLHSLVRRLGIGRGGENGLRATLESVLEDHRDELGALQLGADEIRMLFNILKNGDLRIEDIMVPRVDVVAVDCEMPFGDILRIFGEAAHSRLPLYRGTLDEIIGMVHVRDALKLLYECGADKARVADIQRPVLFVSPSMRAMDLLARMRASRIHMAIIVDEYGGTDGLVTIEDLVEQIVGEIEDEHDTDDPEMIRAIGEGRYDVDARIALADFEEATGVRIENEDTEDIDTLGGLVFSLAGRVPQIGERIRHPSGIRFEVVDADPRRIRRLRVFMPKPMQLRDA
ncbi:MAG: hemolysin family protein [Rhodothalassiaceae bacterium]